MPVSFECTPSSLMAANPCVSCLSQKEMLAVLVAIIAVANDLTVTDIMKDSKCFTCLSEKQMLQSMVTIMGNLLLGENATPQQVIDEMHCLVCSNEHDLWAALLYLLCNESLVNQREQQ